MRSRTRFSAQTLSVLAALSEEPSHWRHGYALAEQTGLKSVHAVPDFDPARRARAGGGVLARSRPGTAAAPSVPAHGRRPGQRDRGNCQRGRVDGPAGRAGRAGRAIRAGWPPLGALIVAVLGTGTVALMPRAAWLRHWLYPGQHLLAAAVHGRELAASNGGGAYGLILIAFPVIGLLLGVFSSAAAIESSGPPPGGGGPRT